MGIGHDPPAPRCIVPGGGLSPDGQSWVSGRPRFFLPVRVLIQEQTREHKKGKSDTVEPRARPVRC